VNVPLRYGLVGCGGFGRFCLEQYLGLPGLECAAVTDADPELARRTAEEFGLQACASPAELFQSDVDLVHLATPPFTHFPLGMAALDAGKHVLSEKPLALTEADAEAMISRSREKGRLLSVNLIMRYNPLCAGVKAVIDGGLLGAPVHAHFENNAKDEFLPPDHWFWNRELSGGIFVEHGVHFFDLFEWWFGPGEVLSAQQCTRPGTQLIDQVNATVRYGGSVLVGFYHGFHQPARRDSQEWRIVFERGTLTMSEWVPTSLALDFLATDAAAAAIAGCFDGAQLHKAEAFQGAYRMFSGRGKPGEADGRFFLAVPPKLEKGARYAQMLRDLLTDQIRSIFEPGRARLVSEQNGLRSLSCAVTARAMSEGTVRPAAEFPHGIV
jgi:predicted dehydrogenase